jgi:hypothetical protein
MPPATQEKVRGPGRRKAPEGREYNAMRRTNSANLHAGRAWMVAVDDRYATVSVLSRDASGVSDVVVVLKDPSVLPSALRVLPIFVLLLGRF